MKTLSIRKPSSVNTQPKKRSKVQQAIDKKRQTNPDVHYVIKKHTRDSMDERRITERDIVKSIEEFDKIYENDGKSVVEKKIGNQIIRTIYSYCMYTKKASVISSYHINKSKFEKNRSDTFA